MMVLYSQPQLSNLVNRKRAKLGLPPPTSTLPDWMEHMLRPKPPPFKIETYTCPAGAAKPDPPDMTWTPSRISGAVAVKDACRLYCITADDIQDLSEHSKCIDLGSVARRAVTLHGGFYAHKEHVRQCRQAEEEMLTRETPEADNRESRFRFSPLIHKQYTDPPSMIYEGRTTSPSNPVAVHYPTFYFSDDDYGCAWEWYPHWEDF
ncbi:hypothetical protein B0H16DRAFT_1522070 [Mycena metata]|uniref:Uncharacterized protein n=1 Tax=Mycena metata TaxID=1033252 RepID=A0AAD7JMU4_9AGAR|nr:hypothetical protein B0H16DRAFT_1522070 [Mycena metata]